MRNARTDSQGLDWIGPTEANTVDYSFGPEELPVIG